VHEVRARADPRLVAVVEAEIGDALDRDKPAIGDTAGEHRRLVAEQPGADRRMDAVGADQHVDRDAHAIVEPGLHGVAAVGEAGEPVAEMNVLAGKSGRDHRQQVATVDRHVGRTVELLTQRVERCLLKCAPVLPAALVSLERTHAVAIERRSEVKPMQHAYHLWRHVDVPPTSVSSGACS
jgi:hypothetical protein